MEINLLVELEINSQSYQEVKDELVKEIAQLDLIITDLQDKLAHLNKVVEVLFNFNNIDPQSRRLARYDYEKINLTGAIHPNTLQPYTFFESYRLSKYK